MRTRLEVPRDWRISAMAATVVVAAVVVVAVVGMVLAAPREATHAAVQAQPVAPTPVPAVTASGVAPSVDHWIDAGIAPGKAILSSTVDTLQVFDAPGGAVTRELSRYTYYSYPLTLMATDMRVVDSDTWYEALLPAKPNGQTGWVKASDVAVSSTNTVIRVYIAERQLDVVVDGVVTLTAPVAVGSPVTPTPLGTFYITDPIDLTAHASAVYGTYALGLSGYSEALDSYKGTVPQIAIHGTNAPQLVGQPVSNGCLRMRNDTVVEVAAFVGLGTPVIISASRADA